jgi:hypothetical protein
MVDHDDKERSRIGSYWVAEMDRRETHAVLQIRMLVGEKYFLSENLYGFCLNSPSKKIESNRILKAFLIVNN